MRVLATVFTALAFLALPAIAQAGCSPAHTADASSISKPVVSAPQSTPIQAPKPAGS